MLVSITRQWTRAYTERGGLNQILLFSCFPLTHPPLRSEAVRNRGSIIMWHRRIMLPFFSPKLFLNCLQFIYTRNTVLKYRLRLGFHLLFWKWTAPYFFPTLLRRCLRGNNVYPKQVEVALCRFCFSFDRASGKTFGAEENCFLEESETLFVLFFGSQKRFPQQMFPVHANGKHLGQNMSAFLPQSFLVGGHLKVR